MVLRVLASHVFKFRQDNSFVQEEFVGDNSGSVPNWRVNATAIFNFGPASFNATARFISAGVLDNEWIEGIDIDNNRVPSISYLDLGGAYKFADERLEAYFRIDNVLNEQPPVVANALLGTNPTLYDTIGRVARVGVRFQF
jgi:outer membrane receptor protein involved in Fe transport